MSNNYKKEREEYNRRIYSSKSLAELKIIGRKKDLLNIDQYTKQTKHILVERLVKGKQLSDYSKPVLLEKAQNEGLNANASMSKNVILQKITNPKLTDLNEKRLRKLAEKEGIKLRDQMTKEQIIVRLEDPTKHYNKQDLKRLARDNNINVRKNIKRQDLINILAERNIITTTPIAAQESNLGVKFSSAPMELIQVVKKKARNAREALKNFKHYIKNLKCDYITPSRLKKLTKQLEKKTKEAEEEHKRIFTLRVEASALKNYTHQFVIDGVENYDPIMFLKDAKPGVINIFKSNPNIKIKLYLKCFMKMVDSDGFTAIKPFAFHSKGNKIILESTNLDEIYEEIVEEIEEEIQKVQEAEGSGWTFVEVENLELHTTKWVPLNGSSYMPLDPYLANKKCLVNMKNEDEECFKWCVLRALNPKDKNAERIDKDLKSKQDTINMKGIQYPVDFRGIDRFEAQNPNISISVLSYNEKDKTINPLKTSKNTLREYDIVLLLLKEAVKEENGKIKEKTHYVLVKNQSALIASQINNHKGTCNICLNCFNGFSTKDALNKHREYCYNNECVKMIMPPPGSFLRFKNFVHSEKAPFVIYADFECKVKPIHNCKPNPNKSYTHKYQKHEPTSFTYYIICFNNSVCEPILRTYTKEKQEDPDTVDIFIKWLEEDVKEIANIKPKEMIFTKEDMEQFNKASDCWICGEALENDRVRDHCHYTGRYRGAAHNSCNLKYKKPKNIPVFFHNLSGYDSHLFIKKLASSDNKENIDCIPNNKEKYISFSKTIRTGHYINKKGEIKDKI